MSYCPACDAAGVPTCSDGFREPVHIGAVLSDMGFDLRKPVEPPSNSGVIRETMGTDKTARQGARTPAGPTDQSLGRGDRQ